jgi:hypothetical protein
MPTKAPKYGRCRGTVPCTRIAAHAHKRRVMAERVAMHGLGVGFLSRRQLQRSADDPANRVGNGAVTTPTKMPRDDVNRVQQHGHRSKLGSAAHTPACAGTAHDKSCIRVKSRGSRTW